ncbi:MAG TPA: Gfo/Idh/MocA family oxidoreductase [Verrucomicrobiae bacterium]
MNFKVKRTSRRLFLSKSSAALASISFLPGSILGLNGATPPSEKLNIAAVGIGGQGGADLDQMKSENIVALVDVDSRRAKATHEKFPNARRFEDFRKMFDAMDKEIDAVLVATPDHTHAVAAMRAIKLKKHVYCEKPLAHSIYEVRELMRAAREEKVVTQLGNQGHSYDSMRVFREWVEDGAIGTVREVHAMCGAVYSEMDKVDEVKKGQPIPEGLNWDLWLGPVKERPYHSAYVPGMWRRWSAFGTGVIGDWTCHVVDPVFWTLNLGAPTTVQVVDTGDWNPERHGETFPKRTIVNYEFPARGSRPAVKLTWYDGAAHPPRPEEISEAEKEKFPQTGALVIGDKGKIIYGSHGAGRPTILNKDQMATVSKEPRRLAKVSNHYKEWIDCCKTGKPAGSDFSYGGPLTEIALIGVIAMHFKGEKLQWDSARGRFTNNRKANQFLKPDFRRGWKL